MTGTPPVETDRAALAARARALVAPDGGRRVLGITGAPGAGKSTLARDLVRDVGDRARLVGMDGFHLSNEVLRALGRDGRKGAPDTFDGAGFVALVRRLREERDGTVYAPRFHRELEESIAAEVEVGPEVGLVVVEGNYLLAGDPPWAALRDLLDDAWYVEVDEDVRLERLVARHAGYGKPPAAARAWALGPDQANAELIARTRGRADLVVRC